jgi:hypothetical protein
MELDSIAVAASAYRTFMTVGGHSEYPPFEELPEIVQAQWEAVVKHLAHIGNMVMDERVVDFAELERAFPAGWLPRRFREDLVHG